MEEMSMSAPAHPAPADLLKVPAGTTAGAAVRDAGLPGRGEAAAIVVVRDAEGKLRDLSWAPDADAEVTPVAADTEDGRSVIRHSAAHVLAQAVQELFPQARLGIGPPITDGFYYDFDVPEAFTPDDLQALEKRMKAIVKASCSPGGCTNPRTKRAGNWPASPTNWNWSTTSPVTPTSWKSAATS
jgi:threonyl-tRNA synthetase